MMYPSVTINGIDMFKTYHAPLKELHSVQPPELKSFYQEVPGGDGSIDLSTAISGRPTYGRREITMNFKCEMPMNRWTTTMSEILKNFHGKEGKIIFEDEPDYYYVGRMTVSDYERVVQTGTFIITAKAEPYKYELTSSLEPWPWDSFNFRTGIIRSYASLQVDGERILTIPGRERWVIPELEVTGTLSLTFGGVTYKLKAGKTKLYDVVIKEGENRLIFTGTGTISVNYRGGIL